MDKRKQDIAYFISFCIEQYKNAKGISGADAVAFLSEYGVLEYLSEHWEVLHTQSRQWLVEDIDDFIRLRDKDCKLLSIENHFENQSLANLTITQENLYLLLPSKLSWMANMLSEDKGVGIVDAMKTLYFRKFILNLRMNLRRRGISVRWHFTRNFKQKGLSAS